MECTAGLVHTPTAHRRAVCLYQPHAWRQKTQALLPREVLLQLCRAMQAHIDLSEDPVSGSHRSPWVQHPPAARLPLPATAPRPPCPNSPASTPARAVCQLRRDWSLQRGCSRQACCCALEHLSIHSSMNQLELCGQGASPLVGQGSTQTGRPEADCKLGAEKCEGQALRRRQREQEPVLCAGPASSDSQIAFSLFCATQCLMSSRELMTCDCRTEMGIGEATGCSVGAAPHPAAPWSGELSLKRVQ